MAAEPREQDKATTGSEAKKGGKFGPGRLLAWVVIIALIGVVFYEWKTRKDFETTSEIVSAMVDDEGAGAKFETAKDKFVGTYTIDEQVDGLNRIVTVTWKSLFKPYVLKLRVGGKSASDEGGTNEILEVISNDPAEGPLEGP